MENWKTNIDIKMFYIIFLIEYNSMLIVKQYLNLKIKIYKYIYIYMVYTYMSILITKTLSLVK